MTSKHTLGPWEIAKAFGNFAVREKNAINLVNSGKWQPEICNGILEKSTADIIAAAPELLEALKKLVKAANSKGFEKLIRNIDEALPEAEEAIAKAEGKK